MKPVSLNTNAAEKRAKTPQDGSAPLTLKDYALGLTALLSPVIGLVLAACLVGGCSYKGGKVVDGTNFAIGLTIPGTEWQINALDYVGGLRVCGNDATEISVTHRVVETNSFFGCIYTQRDSQTTATIYPVFGPATNDLSTAALAVKTNYVNKVDE